MLITPMVRAVAFAFLGAVMIAAVAFMNSIGFVGRATGCPAALDPGSPGVPHQLVGVAQPLTLLHQRSSVERAAAMESAMWTASACRAS